MELKKFRFSGAIPASKSLMNRALIAQSYEPRLRLQGESRSEDVVHLQKSLKSFHRKKVFNCGDGGTTLRFLALRVSREPGHFILKGSARLLKRPQQELAHVLSQLGVQVKFHSRHLEIISQGWREPRRVLRVNAKDSSQFLSALILNAWGLPFDLRVRPRGRITSESYFAMTVQQLKELGLRVSKKGSELRIPRNQKPQRRNYRVESDLSSCFSVAAFAAVSGSAVMKDFPRRSLQPDFAFVNILKQMGAQTELTKNQLRIQARSLKPLRVNLQNSPDLFPVLAVLCAFAKGRSTLYGAPQLVHKESNRIIKTQELLRKAGFQSELRRDGLVIHGAGAKTKTTSFTFDPDKDHRLAMAAGLLKFYGWKIKIKNGDVVKKSFPEFWSSVGVRP